MDITSTIAQEIVSQCKRHSFSVTNSLSTFVLRAQLFAVEKDDRGLAELGPPQIENLVATCVRTLCQIDEPNLETLKMQASLVTIQQTQLNDLRTVKIQHRAKSEHLVDEICRKRNPSECFGDITLYVLHESRLFHTTQEAVHRETIAALESVFPRSLVDHFMTQSEREKKRELEELWKIAFGIRLFNKATRRGGAGIPDVLEDTDRIIRTTQDNLAQKWTAIETTCSMYQSVLSYPSLQLQDLALSRLHSELLNRLQMKTYLRGLRTSLGVVEENYARVRPVWEAMLTELRELVLGAENATVPKCIIYPKFIALCEHWQHVLAVEQDAKEVSEQLEILLTYERSFQPTLRTTDIEEAAKASAPTMRDPVDRDRVEADITAHHSSSVQYLRELPSSTVTANRVTPELAGFCVVTLMDHGILTEGKVEHEDPLCPGFLLLHANSAYYAFSNERALRSFAADPFKYLSQQLIDLICETPALIYLLALHMYLPRELWLIGSRPDANRKAVPTAHGTTQTGQIEPNKDRSYQWNEWELRRLALKLASLRSKRTHVVQTNASHYRRDGVTQTYPLKEQGTQTMKDATTQPIRVIRAIKGLRGDAAQHLNPLEVVTWKVDVDDMKIKKHDAIHAN